VSTPGLGKGEARSLLAPGGKGVGCPQKELVLRISGRKKDFRPHFSLILRIHLGKKKGPCTKTACFAHGIGYSPVGAGE
jgi:hypothetical protein